MAKECLVCGKKLGVLTAKIAVSDGSVCTECWNKAGFDNTLSTIAAANQYNGSAVKELISLKEKIKN